MAIVDNAGQILKKAYTVWMGVGIGVLASAQLILTDWSQVNLEVLHLPVGWAPFIAYCITGAIALCGWLIPIARIIKQTSILLTSPPP
jgi:hypothetical protein